jgi:LacI family transcriptional regulator
MNVQARDALELAITGGASGWRMTTSPDNPERLLIGLVSHVHPTSDLLHPIFEKVLYGIRTRLVANGCDLLLCSTRPVGTERDFRAIAIEQTIGHGVAAFIAWGMSNKGPEVKPILNSGLPAMFIDNDVIGERVGYVMSANVEGCAQVVRHLHDAGRRRIAHISGNLNTRPGPDRLFGYRSELEALGLTVPSEYTEQGDFMHVSGYEAAKRLLALPEPPDAITCASDWMAIGAMSAIEEAGLRVPEDIAVAGFDDIDLAAKLKPSLTTVRQDAVAMGTAAAEAIMQMLADPTVSPPVVIVPTKLVVRESSGPAEPKES